jgi:hypothetical protein
MSGRRVAMDIDVIEKAIKASLEETLKGRGGPTRS